MTFYRDQADYESEYLESLSNLGGARADSGEILDAVMEDFNERHSDDGEADARTNFLRASDAVVRGDGMKGLDSHSASYAKHKGWSRGKVRRALDTDSGYFR